MKLIACILGTIIFIAGGAHAQNAQQVFYRANQLYQIGRFVEARQAYDSLVASGYAGGELYYNLGNAYYKSGDLARAILYYERALRYLPNDDDLRHNLQLANLMITDRIEPTPRLFIWDTWDAAKEGLSVQAFTWLAYLFFVLTIASLVAVILSRTYRTRRMAFTSGAATALVFFALLTVLVARVSDLSRQDSAIVTAAVATVKNSPDDKSSDAFVLHAGVKVEIRDRLSDWIKIRLADGKVGWMESSSAEVI